MKQVIFLFVVEIVFPITVKDLWAAGPAPSGPPREQGIKINPTISDA